MGDRVPVHFGHVRSCSVQFWRLLRSIVIRLVSVWVVSCLS